MSDELPPICFSTLACPHWSWQKILQSGVRFGYQGVEIRLLQGQTDLLSLPLFHPDLLPHRREELQQANFKVAGLGSSVRFDYTDPENLREQIQTGYRYIELAHELRASFVRVFGDVFSIGNDAPSRERILTQIVDGLTALGQHAGPRGVQVLMETHGDFAQSHWMRTVMERVKLPSVGILWDTHHPWRFFDEDVSDSFSQMLPWIRHTHWKDSIATEQPVIKNAASSNAAEQAHALMSGHKPANYVLFGDGEFPARVALEQLKSNGYSNWLSLEWEKAWHPELEEPEVALPDFPIKLRALMESVEWVMDSR